MGKFTRDDVGVARASMTPLESAIRNPEQADLSRQDFELIERTIDRHVAELRAEQAGRKTYKGLGQQRRKELLLAAKTKRLRFSALSDDDLRAIEHTPGFADQLLDLSL